MYLYKHTHVLKLVPEVPHLLEDLLSKDLLESRDLHHLALNLPESTLEID